MTTSTGRLSESHMQGDNSADYPLGLFFLFFFLILPLNLDFNLLWMHHMRNFSVAVLIYPFAHRHTVS